MKRILDLIISTCFLIFFGWLLLMLILISAIIHHSNGIYKQERIGLNKNRFQLFKIQSMRKMTGYTSSVTVKNDPRVSRYGNFIRKYKLDELPQIINVFIGTMSIVGPRPTVIEDAERMDGEQVKRFKVKPGLTGLAQINGNTALSWPQRIVYDLEYIKKQSFFLDLKIIFKTFLLIISNNAETHPQYDDEWQN